VAQERRLHGHILIGGRLASFAGAVAAIRVEHIPYADARADIVAETVIREVSHKYGADTQIPFEIVVPIDAPASDLNLRAHVDVDKDGEVSVGDFVTTQAYPIAESASYTLEVHVVN
jgi:hypothetical protein